AEGRARAHGGAVAAERVRAPARAAAAWRGLALFARHLRACFVHDGALVARFGRLEDRAPSGPSPTARAFAAGASRRSSRRKWKAPRTSRASSKTSRGTPCRSLLRTSTDDTLCDSG